MIEELDSGPYIVKRYLKIDEDTYITEVYEWLRKTIPDAFTEAVGLLDDCAFTNQETGVRILRTFPRKPEDSKIEWSLGTRHILANVRASSRPFTGSFCYLNEMNFRVVIFRASRYEPDFDFNAIPGQVCLLSEGLPVVATGDGMVIIEECSVEGLDAEDSRKLVARSLRNRLL
jgi:methionyl-tRNA formyltransferase